MKRLTRERLASMMKDIGVGTDELEYKIVEEILFNYTEHLEATNKALVDERSNMVKTHAMNSQIAQEKHGRDLANLFDLTVERDELQAKLTAYENRSCEGCRFSKECSDISDTFDCSKGVGNIIGDDDYRVDKDFSCKYWKPKEQE